MPKNSSNGRAKLVFLEIINIVKHKLRLRCKVQPMLLLPDTIIEINLLLQYNLCSWYPYELLVYKEDYVKKYPVCYIINICPSSIIGKLKAKHFFYSFN